MEGGMVVLVLTRTEVAALVRCMDYSNADGDPWMEKHEKSALDEIAEALYKETRIL
tara:strand:+ start:650 stop:817 length:168 start_codon:yes stop_codon:yes gene_type:complete